MYVVRRTFRNYGQMMAPGSTVEPGSIKRFKSRLSEGYIIKVTEQDFDKWDNYFKLRMGVSIQRISDGQNDAGQNDAGQNDAGQNDAGQNDAGQNDAGQNDAGQDDKPVSVAKVVVKPL